MKIAVIGPKEFADRVKRIIKQEYIDVEITIFYYERYIEVISFLEEHQKEFDGILFPGHVSYVYAEKKIKKKETLWEYIPINTGSFYRALIELYVLGKDIYNISIDTYPPEFVYEAYDEIGVRGNVRLLFASETCDDEDYYYYLLEFHRMNYYSGKVQCCITGVTEVWEALLQDGIPCVRTKPTSHVVLDAYNKLYIKHIKATKNNMNIAMLLIHIDLLSYFSTNIREDYEQIASKFEVAKQVNSFASRINGAVIENTDRDFWVLADRKTVERETRDFENLYLSELFSSQHTHHISVGVGLGKTASEAKYNAYIGMSRACRYNISVAFVIYSPSNIKGPIKISFKKAAENWNITEWLQKAGLSKNSANKIIQVMRTQRKNEFTSKELADMCAMSKRNMDRIIQKLEEAGYCRVVGEKMSEAAGRPTRLIELKKI